jgi:hypothetical protein
MHSPTLALSWQLWGRHRLGLATVLLFLVALAVTFNVVPAGTLESRHGALVSIQFVIALIYVGAVFAYGFESQLESRDSTFPARMFTLPVRTLTLVGLPMLQGMATVALLWLAWARFVLQPVGVQISLLDTTLLAAAFVAVLQAVLWSPFGLPWVRVIVAVLLLPLLALAPQLGPIFGLSEPLLIGLYAALIPLSAAAALAGVAHARHSAGSVWRGLPRTRPLVGPAPTGRWIAFPSPARAQLWYEMRRHFLPFPLAVGAFTALVLVLLLLAGWPLEPSARLFLIGNLISYPLLFAPFFGCFLGRTGTTAANPYLLASFTATRPMPCSAVIAAKLKVATLSTLAAWGLVVIPAVVCVFALGSDQLLSRLYTQLAEAYPPWRVAATIGLIIIGPLLLTWRLMVDNLWIGLTGRVWVVRFCLIACGAIMPLAIMAYTRLMEDARWREQVLDALPWAAAAVAGIKLLAAVAIARTLLLRGLMDRAALVKVSALWLAAAGALFILIYGTVPPDVLPLSVLASAAVLGVPLVRLLGAPLVLCWNRHR